jgi:glycosyltransferase involved in cell wall biosynthesis
MRIAFFAESCLPINPKSLDSRALGGTETGVIRLANSLGRKGYNITIFSRGVETPEIDSINKNVTYEPCQFIHKSDIFDVLVLVKDFRPCSFNLPAKKIYFLTGDGPEQYINFGIGDVRVQKRIEKILCVSNWQAEALSSTSGFDIRKTAVIQNGVHLENFEYSVKNFNKRLFYASSPNRGLGLAIKCFAELLNFHPDATFHIFAGFDVYDDHQKFSGPLVEQFNSLKNLASKIPNIFFHGNLIQKELASKICECDLLFYPNQFVETSCIVALEAQAAGCPVIASNSGGLPETVSDRGILISGIPGSDNYTRNFVTATSNLLNDKDTFSKLSKRIKDYAFKNFSWDYVADRFITAINS